MTEATTSIQFVDSALLPRLQNAAQSDSQVKYSPADNVPPNPARLTLDYDSMETPKGKLKAAVFVQSSGKTIGIFASGRGGVGKTCALRGLTTDPDVKEKFLDGTLYVPLGNDATEATVIKGVETIVDLTGNGRLAQRLRSLKSVEEATNKAAIWFKGRKCLFLIDDIW